MFIKVAKYLIPKGYSGMTVFPFVFVKHSFDKDDLVLINHEKIHLRQQLELLILPFFIWYGIEYIFRFFQHKNTYLAYKNISFEREAYANEMNLRYLDNRKFFLFLRYLNWYKK
ncbi:hypothetical protein RCH18_002733 [Flavobacterium sp. PL11]|uniref:hypothetical protein n=1 Tax=Flavobacterium sp. PL11 TaxID=3071717 RepID=UPI002DFBD195|nr:hypothetical protein [Flavobacterium sp. PL11]